MLKQTFSLVKMFFVISFAECGKGSSGAKPSEKNLLAILSITRSSAPLVKRFVISKLTSLASIVTLCSLSLLI